MKVIPAIDLIDGKCARLLRGDFDSQTRHPEDPLARAERFKRAGFERLHVIDLEGARTGRGQNRFTILRLATRSGLRLQVGGGIRSSTDVGELLDAGVERLILGKAVTEAPDRVGRWIAGWGGEKFAIALDLKEGQLQGDGWLAAQQMELPDFLKQIADWGVGYLICTVFERDGTLLKPDYDTYRELAEQLPPTTRLLAAGGVNRPEHVGELARLGVWGAVVGRAVYEEEYPLRQWHEAEQFDAG